MAAWLTFMRERFPVPAHLLLVGGLVVSGATLVPGEIRWAPVLAGGVGLLIFFAVLRLMDELKDHDSDRIAHPDRPLPRGVISVGQATHGVRVGVMAMVLFASCVASFGNPLAAVSYLVVTAYLWLMYREFYCGAWLGSRPLLYAFTHQLVLVPICWFIMVMSSPASIPAAPVVHFTLPILGAFFGYEVCRKLDPQADPVLETYLQRYGRLNTFLLVAVAMAVAATGAWSLGLAAVLWPFELVLLLGTTLVWLRPQAFRVVEAVAQLNLVAHLWAIPLHTFWSGP